ncbi:hypothetical protein N7478_011417 [Penicillium angulare]|uniref:uncharacterized protein n=1 Tax=Penicillium angulare TaxID=116970 RepID=UPI00254249F4|nr:uncharacterized protein N7478_011417 [Penicillium angulare]KAJ5263812.1 hypothetical protein N7478_011417 [Penicillium angulare]
MPENYDHPPASSRRPSLPSEGSSPNIPPLPPSHRRTLWNHLVDQHSQRESATLEGIDLPRQTVDDDSDLDTILSEVRFGGFTHRFLDQLLNQNQSEETPRDSQPPARPRDRLIYLRNLIHSESNRTDTDATIRALETLNREIEDHYIDQARIGNMTFMQAQAALDTHRRMFGVENPRGSRNSFVEHLIQNPPSTVSPANLEPRPPSNRTLRRRSFRPDLRESLPTPSLMPQTSQSGRDRDRDRDRRLKRRKLDADDNREGSRGFNYGHQGQVVPGALKMEIASCDGGMYDPDGDCAFPDNVLRNDQSVYSTKADRCNLVLRHKDEAPFCLKKIVIKAPRSGLDLQLQEGMVFVSMSSDEALARTSQYQIQYSNRRHRRQHHRRMGMQPSQEYLTGSRNPLQSLERTVLVGPDSNLALTNEVAERSTHDPQSEFRVTTDHDDTVEENLFVDREEDSILPSVAELERVNEDDDLLSDTDDESPSDDYDEDNATSSFASRHRFVSPRRAGSTRRQAPLPSQRRRPPPSFVDPPPAVNQPGSSLSTPNTDVLVPYARFFIERDKSMVSIKFDPPP